MIKTNILVLVLLVIVVQGIKQTKDVRLYPNTENSPSIYMLSF